MKQGFISIYHIVRQDMRNKCVSGQKVPNLANRLGMVMYVKFLSKSQHILQKRPLLAYR